jgi:hypothetical protein
MRAGPLRRANGGQWDGETDVLQAQRLQASPWASAGQLTYTVPAVLARDNCVDDPVVSQQPVSPAVPAASHCN